MALNMSINVYKQFCTLDKYNMKFGVYSYSMYENADDARYEAHSSTCT